MPNSISNRPSINGSRDITISLEPISGGITLMYAFIEGARIIQADGTRKASWSGKIPLAQIRVKVRVVGIDRASFKFGIDLPGTLEDQSLSFTLQDGYYETEITL